jgi:hypothetical protein
VAPFSAVRSRPPLSRRVGSTPAARPGSRLLPRLTALRAFAALAVFVFHLHAHHVASLPWGISAIGGAGVAFFFVLSGFVLAWGTPPGLPARTFYRRRFAGDGASRRRSPMPSRCRRGPSGTRSPTG